MVAGIALIFAFTFLGLVWLARDVDRGVSNRSAAQSIAFQAARSGAQATSISGLRGPDAVPTVDDVRRTQLRHKQSHKQESHKQESVPRWVRPEQGTEPLVATGTTQ